MVLTDDLKRIVDRYQELASSEENAKRQSRWGNNQHISRDLWRGTAKTDGSCRKGEVPVLAGLSNLFFHSKYNFSMEDYLLKPEVYLGQYLTNCIDRFEHIHDDFVLDYQIPIRMASVYEAGFLGQNPMYGEHVEPHFKTNHVYNDIEDYKKLPEFDFYKTGLMPKALHLFDYMQERVGDVFEVHFPEWIRAPFGVALYLRGFNDLLMDTYDDDEAVHDFLSFITDTQITYIKGQAKYTGRGIRKICLYNDDISHPIVSPQLYREFILPQEKRLEEFCGGIEYWHSCGNLDYVYEGIKEIPNLGMIHCSAWSDKAACVKSFPDVPIEVCTNTQKEVLDCTDDEIFDHFKDICKTLNDGNSCGYDLNLETMEMQGSIEETYAQCNRFVDIARRAAIAAAE